MTIKTYLKDVLFVNVSAWSVSDWTVVQTALVSESCQFFLIP